MKHKFRRKSPYYFTLLASAIFITVYFILRYYKPSEASEIVMTVLAIIAGITFWLEYHHNSLIQEAEFIVDLNNQFLGDENLCQVEHWLEQYNELDLEITLCENQKEREEKIQDRSDFAKKLEEEIFPISSDNRQKLVNYLVHLEGIATLVDSGVLKLNTINDLMAYRYFIAVNNPAVQNLELKPYSAYYKGITSINKAWKKKIGDNMPLKDTEWKP